MPVLDISSRLRQDAHDGFFRLMLMSPVGFRPSFPDMHELSDGDGRLYLLHYQRFPLSAGLSSSLIFCIGLVHEPRLCGARRLGPKRQADNYRQGDRATMGVAMTSFLG